MVDRRRRLWLEYAECGQNETSSTARGLEAQQPISGRRYKPSTVRLRHPERHVSAVPAQQKPYVFNVFLSVYLFNVYAARILSPMTWFGLSHSCCRRRLAIFVVPIQVKTILELFRPAFGILPKTGDAKPVDWRKPGWERLRTICARSILAWWRQGGAFWIDRYGVNSWRRPRLRDMFRRKRERKEILFVIM